MKKLKILNIESIRKLRPCYDPAVFLDRDWSGTIRDFLKIEEIPPEDRIWVVLRLLPPRSITVDFIKWCLKRSSAPLDKSQTRSFRNYVKNASLKNLATRASCEAFFISVTSSGLPSSKTRSTQVAKLLKLIDKYYGKE